MRRDSWELLHAARESSGTRANKSEPTSLRTLSPSYDHFCKALPAEAQKEGRHSTGFT